MELIGRANKYIDGNYPVDFGKGQQAFQAGYRTIIWLNHSGLSQCCKSVLTRTPEKIRQQLGIEDSSLHVGQPFRMAGCSGSGFSRGEAVFPRLDVEQELKALEELQSKTGKTVGQGVG